MTDTDLNGIRERAEKATPGPWTHERHGCVTDPAGMQLAAVFDPVVREDTAGGAAQRVNATFIAAAREDVPALVAEVERLRARLGLAEAVLDRCWDISGAPGLCAALDAWRAAKEADGG